MGKNFQNLSLTKQPLKIFPLTNRGQIAVNIMCINFRITGEKHIEAAI
jgi:hypothetical protein